MVYLLQTALDFCYAVNTNVRANLFSANQSQPARGSSRLGSGEAKRLVDKKRTRRHIRFALPSTQAHEQICSLYIKFDHYAGPPKAVDKKRNEKAHEFCVTIQHKHTNKSALRKLDSATMRVLQANVSLVAIGNCYSGLADYFSKSLCSALSSSVQRN